MSRTTCVPGESINVIASCSSLLLFQGLPWQHRECLLKCVVWFLKDCQVFYGFYLGLKLTHLWLVSRVIRLSFLGVVKQFLVVPADHYALEEGMAAHSSVLAWRIPWTEEPAVRSTKRVRSTWGALARTHVSSNFIYKTWKSVEHSLWTSHPCVNGWTSYYVLM